MSEQDRGFGTRAVHAHERPRAGALTSPIVQSSTFAFDSAAQMRRYLDGAQDLYLYTRHANPTLHELEEALAALEGAEAGVVFASGMAAITTTLLALLRSGDEVIARASLYGGTTRFLRHVLPDFGVETRLVSAAELERLGELITPRTKVVIFESPANPSLEVADIRKVAAAAREKGVLSIIDSTFATPVLQRPLPLGVDLVVHSLTKALSGHSDVVGGAVLGSRELVEPVRNLLRVMGGCLDPHAAFLALRGLKTVHLRVERQCANALALARAFEGHPKVARVLYPGLPSHPGHEVARAQMAAFGGIVSLSLKGGLQAAERFYDALQVATRAASLGGVETLVSLPVHTSHHGYTAEQLAEAGVGPGMVRISTGIEDTADLVADVEQALGRV